MSGIAPVALGSNNEKIKSLRRLIRQSKARSSQGAFVADGPTLVVEALRSSLTVRSIYIGDGPERKDGLDALAAAAADGRAAQQLESTTVYQVDNAVLTSVLDPTNPRPLAAVVESPRWDLADLDSTRPIMVAVELRDPGNIGTLIRSSEAAGCAAVVTVGNSVDFLNPKAVRGSAGSVFRLPVLSLPDLSSAIAELRGAKRHIVAAVIDPGAPAYEQVDLRSAAILVGNEPRGLSQDAVALADAAVTIPMAMAVESLNVAAAGAILAFEASRQRRERSGDQHEIPPPAAPDFAKTMISTNKDGHSD